nr:alpha/beta hydrolase [uncultured Sphingomonas sp.]
MAIIETALGQIGYLDQGSGDETPILFLHGVGSDKSVWVPQLQYFGGDRRAVSIDYPGYGDSQFWDDANRDDFAAAAFALMDALGIDRAHICGLSLGGVVAIAMHEAAAQRCASLIIADSFAVHPEGRAIYDRSVAASEAMPMAELAAARAPLLMGATASDELKQDVIATMAAIDPAAYRLGARAVWLADQRDRAARIRVPTLILCGDEDHITPWALSEALAEIIPDAELVMVNGSGHLANIEQEKFFNEVADRFISALAR